MPRLPTPTALLALACAAAAIPAAGCGGSETTGGGASSPNATPPPVPSDPRRGAPDARRLPRHERPHAASARRLALRRRARGRARDDRLRAGPQPRRVRPDRARRHADLRQHRRLRRARRAREGARAVPRAGRLARGAPRVPQRDERGRRREGRLPRRGRAARARQMAPARGDALGRGAARRRGDGDGAATRPCRPSATGAAVHTPTLASVGGDVAKIDTRVPPSRLHESTSPTSSAEDRSRCCSRRRRCADRACAGPSPTRRCSCDRLRRQVAFIHNEVYVDNDRRKGCVRSCARSGSRASRGCS